MDSGNRLGSFVTSHELHAFSAQLKDIVWLVRISSKFNSDDSVTTYGSAFSVYKCGFIMTSCHLFNKSGTSEIMARRLSDEGFVFKASVVYLKPSYDIAVLQVENISDCVVGRLANDGTLTEGQNIYHVGSPGNFVWSFLVGKAVFPCIDGVKVVGSRTCRNYGPNSLQITPQYRVMGDIWYRDLFEQSPRKKFTYEKNLHPLIPIIQISSLSAKEGCSGGPVFNSSGDIVGMLALESDGYDIAIHVSLLKQVLEELEKQMQSGDTRKDICTEVGPSKRFRHH